MLAFQETFDKLAEQCKAYQQEVDKRELWYTEPHQHRYLAINRLLRIHLDKRLTIEAMAAGEQSAPGFPSLNPARRQYYELAEKVPPFLASGSDSYYYLQTYRIATTWLLKTFSYSTYKGDWEKSRNLISWLSAIDGKQEKHDVSGSINKSLDDIRKLGDLSQLSGGDLRTLEKEVRNIQALLNDNPNMESELSNDQLELLAKASEHLEKNQDVLAGLPKIDDSFHYEEPPAIDVLAYRCRQLTVLADDFTDDYDPNLSIEDFPAFKKRLKESFNRHIQVCEDVYLSIVDQMGAYQKPSLGDLCKMLYDGFMFFTNDTYLIKRYPNVHARHLDIERGLPDTIDLEVMLMIAIDQI